MVQRDIPRILEAFLSFLTVLEEYQVEVMKLYVPPTPDEIVRGDAGVLGEKERTRVEVAKATEAICAVADGAYVRLRVLFLVWIARVRDVLTRHVPLSQRSSRAWQISLGRLETNSWHLSFRRERHRNCSLL